MKLNSFEIPFLMQGSCHIAVTRCGQLKSLFNSNKKSRIFSYLLQLIVLNSSTFQARSFTVFKFNLLAKNKASSTE